MKRLVTASVLALVGGFAACAVEDPVPPDLGTGGTGMGGSAPSGGTDMGGSAPTGGTGMGGSAPTGGTNTGGIGPTGGAGGISTGGTPATGGLGGMTGGSGGMTGGSGGMTGGSGGMTGGSGGMTGGMAGMAGGGAGGTAGGSGVPTIQELVGNLDGHLVITPCGDTPNTDDCAGGGWRSNAVNNGANNPCSGGRLEAVIPFQIGGTPGTEYDVTMHFYGIMEPRQYSNVMRETTGATNRNGSTPTGWAEAAGNASVYSMGDNNYNTYEIFVYDQNDMRVRQYFINSDSGTGHYTLITNYAKTITVIGGGEVRLRVFDANCRQIKNCGANGGAPCTGDKPRSVNIAAAMPQPTGMPMLQQPGLGQPPEHSGQWWLIDVTGVALGN